MSFQFWKKIGNDISIFWNEYIYFSLLFGPLCGFVTALIVYGLGFRSSMVFMLGITMHMVIWWLEGKIRMGLTGLLPMVLLPCFGISNGTKVSQIYFSDSVVVCMGSLIMASAVEIYQLHHRAAKIIMSYAKGGGLSAILAAFVFLTGFISMWLSNTATAALMIPLSRAIFIHIERHHKDAGSDLIASTGVAIDLSIAFAASLGGMATLTGTGSNLVLQGTMMSIFGKAGELTFIEWFIMAAPLTIINLFLLWGILSSLYLCRSSSSPSDFSDNSVTTNPAHIPEKTEDTGLEIPSEEKETEENPFRPLSYPEKVVILSFIAMALLWMTRDPPGDWGWAQLLGIEDMATDGTVAIGACLVLLILPNRPPECKSRAPKNKFQVINQEESSHQIGDIELVQRQQDLGSHTEYEERNDSEDPHEKIKPNAQYTPVLPWRVIKELNWDILFLLGGGFALSHGFQESGLTEYFADLITSSGPKNLHALVIISSFIACFCTNLMSNVAAANVLLPSLACVGPKYGYSPLVVLVPVALSISLALLFPIGTPPNAIILTNKRVRIIELFKVGAICTLVFLTTILLYCIYLLPLMFPLSHVSESIQDSCS